MGFRKYEVGPYEEMRAQHSWDVPERYNIAHDVCDKHERERLAMVWEDWRGTERRVSFGELQDLSSRFANVLEANGVGARRSCRDAAAVAARDRGGLHRHLQARRDPALAVGALRRRRHPASPQRLAGDGGRHRRRKPPPNPGGDGRDGVRDGRRRRRGRRRLRRGDGGRRHELRDRRHGRRRSGAALLLVGHDRQGQGHPARPPLPARARGVRVLPRRARRRALPRLGRVGLGGRHRAAARSLALRRRRARAGAQGRLRPRGASALPVQARRREHVHHADRAARDDRRGGRRHALPARASCASAARPASR